MTKYQTFVADPPWRYSNTASRGAAENHYPTMSIDELCDLSVVPDNAADKALLFLWVTASHMPSRRNTCRPFLSFSRAAVRQVLLRCKDILTAGERRQIAVRTYHAFCMDILRSHGRLLNGKPPTILFPGPERLAKAQYSGDWAATGPITPDGDKQNQIRKGMLGSMLNIMGYDHTYSLQQMAMQSRLKIPLLFGQDVIHGF